ncbi:hypothetical protein J2741_001259 [Methanolinea mesophila]|uniref:DUF7287 family protein n=1 Tax=Methanolinea mesophila TaxID=547055 RepID=UPI001AE280EF|nr:hypothetical protein [Methanolinea mesophila]MBP1928712.1 hypothetical protein [Methanolinea mesophila]
MPGSRAISPEDANLSIDFIVGFTIFMIAFIFVATMMSGLLVSLQSRTVDYDAVAYRTSVVLVEDPGQPRTWNLLDLSYPEQRDSLKRLGLSIARGYPGILQQEKVDKFFTYTTGSCSGDQLCYPSEYKNKLIFGDYPYNFNISLRKLDQTTVKSVGDPVPLHQKTGYIRRAVDIKQSGAQMQIETTSNSLNFTAIEMDFSTLYILPNQLYRIDPLNEEVNISFSNITVANTHFTQPPSVCVYPTGGGSPTCIPIPANSPTLRLYIDSVTAEPDWTTKALTNNSRIIIEDGFFKRIGLDQYSKVAISLNTDNSIFTFDYPYIFNYTTALLLPPEPAVMEVSVW